MYDLLAISVTLPMLLSVVSFGWSRAFGDTDRFPGSARLHALLILLQVLSVTMVYGFPSRFSFLVISLLYFVQGVGVAYFIRKREGGLRLSRASDQLQARLSINWVQSGDGTHGVGLQPS